MKLKNLNGVTTLHETETVYLKYGSPKEDDEGKVTQPALAITIRTLPLDIDLALEREVPGDSDGNDEIGRLRNVALLYKALVPGQITFDAEEPGEGDKSDFYRDILTELTDIGFSLTHFQVLIAAILELNKMTEDDIEAAEEVFTTGS